MTREQQDVIFRSAIGRANKAGMQALERGEEYLTAFDVSMQNDGFGYTGAACHCTRDGETGHAPECGWSFIGGGSPAERRAA